MKGASILQRISKERGALKKNIFESCISTYTAIGIIMTLGIIIASISMIMTSSMPVAGEIEDMTKPEEVEQAFIEFDSSANKVVLEESPIKTIYVSLMEGTINVKGNAKAYDESNIRIEIYNETSFLDEFTCNMGTVEYRFDDRTVAYEGGGVWSKDPTDESFMISPPEFKFHGQTLTIPIVKINGNASIDRKGDVGITITSSGMPDQLYPNATASSIRTNPVITDDIRIYIKSDYYEAWADYVNTFEQLSATVYDENETAIITLKDCSGDIEYLYVISNELDTVLG